MISYHFGRDVLKEMWINNFTRHSKCFETNKSQSKHLTFPWHSFVSSASIREIKNQVPLRFFSFVSPVEIFLCVILLSYFSASVIIIARLCHFLRIVLLPFASPSNLTWFNFSRIALICSSCLSISNWINLDSWWCLRSLRWKGRWRKKVEEKWHFRAIWRYQAVTFCDDFRSILFDSKLWRRYWKIMSWLHIENF